MSTHNICFHGEIRKIFTGYPPLPRPMIILCCLHDYVQRLFFVWHCYVKNTVDIYVENTTSLNYNGLS